MEARRVKRRSLFQRIRNNFLTGLIVVAPIGITLYLTWTVVDYVDEVVLPQVLPLVPEAYHPDNLLPFSLPGLGLVVFILFLIFIGGLAKNFFGREIIRIGERWVDRMPIVRSVYNALKQIAETIFAESAASFEKACLVEYPRRGIWAIAFISTDTKGEVRRRAADGAEMLSVFLPTTPNPTSGFLLFVPKKDVKILDMSVEEAAKLIISAGLISPPENGAAIAPLDPSDGRGAAGPDVSPDAVSAAPAPVAAASSPSMTEQAPRAIAAADGGGAAPVQSQNHRPFSARHYRRDGT